MISKNKQVFVIKKLPNNYRLKKILNKNFAFCFPNKKIFLNFVKKKYGIHCLNSLQYITHSVPNYTDCGLIKLFETKDRCNKKIILSIGYEKKKIVYYQVMMEWEKSYMENCVDFLNPVGNVLEFGFGLGYSASQFLKHNIQTYTVVEKDPVIYSKALHWSQQYKDKNINIVLSDWRNFVPSFKFDVFFFDTHESNYSTETLHNFFNNNSNIKSKFGGYCVGEAPLVSKGKYNLERFEEFKTKIPSDVAYVGKNQKLFLVCYEKHDIIKWS